jgi:hypothetical protein
MKLRPAHTLGLCFLFVCTLTHAEEARSGAAAAATASKPAAVTAPNGPSLQVNYLQRVRNEDWNNIYDWNDAKDDQRIQMRYKERFALLFKSPALDFTAGLDTELNKKYALNPTQVVANKFNSDEVVFEALNVKLKKLPIPGLALIVGRMDLNKGEGFLLLEGSSGDGSRSTYFNAANLSYQHAKSTFELIGILDPRQDRFFPIIHNQHKYLNEWDEQGIAAYYTDRNHKNSDIDAYYFYKKEVNDYRAATNVLFQPNRQVNTLGGRLAQRNFGGLSITGELAGQWGKQHANAATATPAKDIRAWGGYLYAKKSFDLAWKPTLQAGFIGLSGTDATNTSTINGFDPLFSRWPKWSELYLYSLLPEKGVGYWSNDKMLQIEGTVTPIKPLTLRATLYEEYAFHPAGIVPATYGTGTHRGENYQFRGDYIFNDKWRYHFLYEKFVPGDFYAGKDSVYFVQTQVVYQFTSKPLSLHHHAAQ